VTHNDKNKKSKNLPLFSRISLMRNLKALQVLNVKAGYGFVEDRCVKAEGKKKTKKRKIEEPAYVTGGRRNLKRELHDKGLISTASRA